MSKSKKRILRSSQELFGQNGYHKTTLADIARSVGKVKTAIYYYFSGKEEIFAELVKLEAQEFYEQIETAISSVNLPIEKLEIYIESRIQLMTKISKRYHFLKKEFFELMPIVEENREEYYQKEIGLIESVLELGIKEQAFKVVNPKFSATMLVNTMKGLEVQMFVTDKILVDGLDIPAFRDYILYGLIKK